MDAINYVTARIFLDLDGVLADFDKRAGQILGTDNIYKYEFVYGSEDFWKRLNGEGNFFDDIELMPDALTLWYAVRRFNPFVLTALPSTRREIADKQKRQWVREHLGSDVQVITCSTKDKPAYCHPGDVLIDDRAVNAVAWEARGGHYIVHTSAADSIAQLAELGIL